MVVDWIIYAAVALAAASAASSVIQSRKMKKQAEKAATEAAAVQLSGHDSNRGLYVVYGEALVGATVVWKGVTNRQIYPATPAGFTKLSIETQGVTQNGSRGRRNLYRAVALCEGPVEEIKNVIVDGTGYNDEKFTKRTNQHWDCYAHNGDGENNQFTPWTTGQDSPANPGVLSQWDSTKAASYIAMAYENCYLGGKSPAFQGEPSTKYLVKGRKIYDPREDGTIAGQTGSQRHDDESTWAYSNNPALCVLDYLTATRYGKGLDIADIELSTFIAAADACDEQVEIPAPLTNTTGQTQTYYDPFTGSSTEAAVNAAVATYRNQQVSTVVSGTHYINRFSMNIALDPSSSILDNVNEMLNSFKANLLYVNGQYRLHMDGVETSAMSITDDDINGTINITNGSREDRLNHVKINFVNANKQHKEDTVAWPKLDSQTYADYVAEDNGEELHEEISINGITDYYQAEDLAEFLVRDSRNNLTLNLGLSPRFAVLVPGDVVDVTTTAGNYANQYFRVQQVTVDPNTLNVKATLRQYDSSVYTWDSSRGNEPLGYTFDAGRFNDELDAMTGLSASASINTESDGSTTNYIDVSWNEIETCEPSAIEILWSTQGNNAWNSVMVTDPDTQTSVQFQVPFADITYDITARYRALMNDGNSERVSISANATTTVTVGALTGSRLDGIEPGATVGATWDTGSGGNLIGQPANADIMNSLQEWAEINNKEVRPSSSANVNNWNVSRYDAPIPSGAVSLHIQADKGNNTLRVHLRSNSSTSAATVKFELEVYGASFASTALFDDSTDNTSERPSWQASDIDWGTTTGNVWAPNGILIEDTAWGITSGTADDGAGFTLDNFTSDVEFRLRITEFTNSADRTMVTFGDTVAISDRLAGNTPVEFWFAATDTADNDALLLTNGPSEAGATNGATWNGNINGQPGDAVITNFDEATALGFNPSFSDWTGTRPAGYLTFGSGDGTITKNTTDTLIGPHSVGWVTNGSANYGMYRRISTASPSISMEWSGDSVIIGSFDAYIDSYTSGTGAGVMVRWYRGTAGTNYADKFATVDTSIVGSWQRVYFKISENDRSNAAALTAGNWTDLTVFVLGSYNGHSNTQFNGTIYFDNLRFAVLDPSVENERTTWDQVSANGGAGIPEDNATNGAQAGTNLYDENGNPIGDTDVLNSEIPTSLTINRSEIAFISLDGGTSYSPSYNQTATLTAHPSGDTGTFTVNASSTGSLGSSSVTTGFTQNQNTSGFSSRTITITHTASGETVSIYCFKSSNDVTGGGGKDGTVW